MNSSPNLFTPKPLPPLPPDTRRFEDAPSACAPEFGTARRIDPFFHGLWGDGSQASWSSRRGVETRAATGRWVPPAGVTVTQDRALDQLLYARDRDAALSAIASTLLWRTATVEQIASMVGSKSVAAKMQQAWSAGLVDGGQIVEADRARAIKLPALYRPLNSKAFDKLSDRLDFADWARVTMGLPFRPGTTADRHNIVATELGLRVAEFCKVGTVLGESLSGVGTLTSTDQPESATADLTIIRLDGMRIGVEITASAGPQFPKKAERWARALNDQSPKGIAAVIFVEAVRYEDTRRSRSTTIRAMRKHISEAAWGRPGYARSGVPQRMFLASWTDWFPRPGLVAPAFRNLDVLAPTGPRGDRWRPARALDSTALPFSDPAGQALLDNRHLLIGTPHWLRDAKRDDLRDVMLHRAGLTEIPSLPLARPEQPRNGRGITAAQKMKIR